MGVTLTETADKAPGPDSYRVFWSAEDGEYVAVSERYGPSLSNLDADPVRALEGLIGLIASIDNEETED